MNMTSAYHRSVLRGKQYQRGEAVRLAFGGQTQLARLLGVDQSMVNHLIMLRRSSERLERDIVQRIRAVDPKLVKLWSLPEIPRGLRRGMLMKVAAVIAAVGLIV